MATAMGSILRAATRSPGQPLNILTFPTHERYESGLALTGHNFYSYRAQGIKDWNRTYAPIPSNYVLLNPERGEQQIPPDVDFDLVLSQNKFGQFQLARRLADKLHLPLVSLEHTLPPDSWSPERLAACKAMRGDINVFISDYSVGQWGWDKSDPSVTVVKHGIGTNTFKPANVSREGVLLSVVNDWVNRDWCCGFRFWQEATDGLPVRVVGNTPGLSEPAKSVEDLVNHYSSSQVFVNTSLVSPIPTALMEAMACGCAVVSTNNCMIPEVVEHGVNGLLANNPNEMRRYCKQLLGDPDLCRRLGAEARETIRNFYSLDTFTAAWNSVLFRAANTVYKGAA